MKSFFLFIVFTIQSLNVVFASSVDRGTVLKTSINGTDFSYTVNHNGWYGSGQIHPNFNFKSTKLFVLHYLSEEPNVATEEQIFTRAEEHCEMLAMLALEEFQDERFTYELNFSLLTERGYFYSEPQTVAGSPCEVQVTWLNKN